MPYYERKIYAGKTIEVYKGYSKTIGKHESRGSRKKKTPEEMEKANQRRAEDKLRRLINTNFGYGDFHLVLTYRKDERPSPAVAKKELRNFLMRLKRVYQKIGAELKYITVTEYKNTAIHHHLVINDVKNQNIPKLIQTVWKKGHPKFTPLDDTGQYQKLAEYLIKETSKTFKEPGIANKQRYSPSRNLKKPIEKVRVIKASSWRKEPKAKKGYYLDKESVVNGTNGWTGQAYQSYTMIKLEKVEPWEKCGKSG